MRERPILFSAPMVRAILAGTKTQTRRLVREEHFRAQPPDEWTFGRWQDGYADGRTRAVFHNPDGEPVGLPVPYGERGDRLWVKEAYRLRADQDDVRPSDDWWKSGAWYAADGVEPSGCGGGAGRLRPSIHMPRWASRLLLEVTDVRVERLQAITGEDARAEGVEVPRCDCEVCTRTSAICPADATAFVDDYRALWDSLNAKRAPWASNPWVWVVSFARVIAGAKGVRHA